jgi:hypothetical protein
MLRHSAALRRATPAAPERAPETPSRQNGGRGVRQRPLRNGGRPDPEPWPISPELILVSPPEVAQRARQLLPEPTDLPAAARPIEPAGRRAPAAPARRPVRLPGREGFVVRVLFTALVIAAGAAGFAAATYWGNRATSVPARAPATATHGALSDVRAPAGFRTLPLLRAYGAR